MLVAILSVLTMLAMGGTAKALTGDWLHPSAMFCSQWGFVCGVAILIAPEDITSASGPLFILLNTAIVFAGAIAGTSLACTSRSRRVTSLPWDKRRMQPWSDNELRTLTALCTILGLLYVVVLLRTDGIELSELKTFRGLAKVATSMSEIRYATIGQPVAAGLQWLLTVFYAAPLFGGTLYSCRRRPLDATVSLLSLLPSIVAFSAQSTKSSVVFGVVMWAAGNMSSREYFGMPVHQIRRKVLYLGALGIPAVLLLISAGVVLRAGGATAAQLGQSVIGERTKNYMCGHIGALSQWLDETDLTHIRPSLGRFTVAGPYEVMFGDIRAGGIMPDNAILATGQTNVYTYFRQLVEDLTLPGSLIAVGVLAVLWGFAYRRAREHSRIWIGVLATCYCGALLVMTSIFNYNSIIVAVMLYGAWWWSPWRVRRGLVWAQQAS